MRALRLAALVFAGLLALLIAAAWLGPGLLDWNRYRETITALASSGLGRPVIIKGDISLRLLPQPMLTASDIKVPDDGSGVSVSARDVRLRVALSPLLTGRIDTRELVIHGADLRVPWPPPPGVFANRPPAWLTRLRARVEDARLTIGTRAADQIDADIANDPDTGAFALAGTARIAGRTWHVTTQLGQPGSDRAAALSASVEGEDELRGTGVAFSGILAADGGLDGRISGHGRDLSALLPAPALPWRADGRMNAGSGLAIADDLALELSGAPARGAVALRVGEGARLDLAITTNRLDLGAWLPALAGAKGVSLPIGIDLSAEAAVLGDGVLRRLRAAFELSANGAVSLREASAVLPGDADLRLLGRLSRDASGRLGFDGSARLDAPQLRATLVWLASRFAPELGSLPEDVLHTGRLSANIVGSAQGLSLSHLAGTLDGADARGEVAVTMGARPRLQVRLSTDRLALDGWRGLLHGRAQWFGPLAFDLTLRVARASFTGIPIDAMALDLQGDGAHRIALGQFSGTARGVRVTAAGTLFDDGHLAGVTIDAETPDVSPIAAILPAPPPVGVLRMPAHLALAVEGPIRALTARMAFDLGDARAEVNVTVDGVAQKAAGSVTLRHPGARRFVSTMGVLPDPTWLGDGSLSLTAQMVAQAGRIVIESFDLTAAAARLSGQLTIDLAAAMPAIRGRIMAETLPLPAPNGAGNDGPSLGWAAFSGWSAALQVDARAVLLAGTPILTQATSGVVLDAGRLTLTGLSGQLGGGRLSGGLVLATASEPPRIEATLSIEGAAISGPLLDLPIDLTAGRANVAAALTASGHGAAAFWATLAGSLRATIADGQLSGVDVPGVTAALRGPAAQQRVRSSLSGGTTGFSTMGVTADLAHGIASGVATIEATDGTIRAEGSIDIPRAEADLTVTVRPIGVADAPEIGLRLTGPLDHPTRAPSLAGLARWLAERTP